MARRSGSLGTLLQGVSQQPDRVRQPGQVTEQVNLISDVTRGLSTRPATNDGALLTFGTADMDYHDVQLNGTRYIIGSKDGEVHVWDTNGVYYPVTNTGDLNYFSDTMRYHVTGDNVICVNREKTVRAAQVVPGNPFNVSVFYSLGGQFYRSYLVKISFSAGAVITASFTTPDGSSPGHANQTRAAYIMDQLQTQIEAQALPPGTVITRYREVLSIAHPNQTISIVTSDDEGGELLRAVNSSIKDIEDLPKYAPNGMVVEVLGSNADEDNYWLEFDAVGVTTVNGAAGMGVEGTWRETFSRTDPRNFLLTTMPHKLTLNGTGDGFDLAYGDWIPRPVGDSKTAPFASIVDKRIRDITGFESRLVLLSQDSVVMSRTDEPFDLWRNSATVISATDPVDISSTKKDSLRLDWLVQFDRDLFIMADPGDSQFVIKGGGIEPETASMVLTTEFTVQSSGTPPVSTGRTILMPFKKGVYSGIKEFYTDAQVAVNAANTLTETQDRYINGGIKRMSVSPNYNLGLFLTDSEPKTLYTYKYLWDGSEPLQSAWAQWRFMDDLLHFFFDGSEITLLSIDLDGDVFLHTLDLNVPVDAFGFHIMLDRKLTSMVNGDYVDLPYKDARFLQSYGCANPGLELLPTSSVRLNSGTVRYYFDPDEAPNMAAVISGQGVPWELKPSQVFGVDYQGNIDTSQRITVQEYVLSVFESGTFRATMDSPYGAQWTYDYETFPFDNEPAEDENMLYTGTVSIPWGDRADWTKLTLSGDDLRPWTLHELEWVGQILQSKGRRI